MKKGFWLIVACIAIVIVIVCVAILFARNTLPQESITGKLLICATDPTNKSASKQYAVITPNEDRWEYYGGGGWSQFVFAPDGDSFYYLGKEAIIRRWLDSGMEEEVFSLGDVDCLNWQTPQLVDDDILSFADLRSQRLYLADLHTMELYSPSGIAFWPNATQHDIRNQTVLYTPQFDPNGIYKTDMQTGKQEKLLDGANPSLNEDGTILAYQAGADNGILVVRDLESQEEWTVKVSNVRFFQISPDGRFLGVIHGADMLDHIKLTIFEYQTGRKCTLLRTTPANISNSFDWIDA